MKNEVFIASKNITDEETNLILDYYLIEDSKLPKENIILYGIKINKYTNMQRDSILESNFVSGITTSKITIITLLDKLVDNTVTPIGMYDAIDDYITLNLCS